MTKTSVGPWALPQAVTAYLIDTWRFRHVASLLGLDKPARARKAA